MDLKKQIKEELTLKKETERLENVKANSKIEKVTIYTTKNDKAYLDHLTQEGIRFENIYTENSDKWKETTAITNLGLTPTLKVNNLHLVRERDFMNPTSLVNAIKYLSNPAFTTPINLNTLLEHSKTNQFNIFNRINQLEQRITPLISFIQNLEKQISEEDDA
tara:strand:+ start:58 stop:546 length:489 start_codon:yes stop_codon:yes gene_type:complete